MVAHASAGLSGDTDGRAPWALGAGFLLGNGCLDGQLFHTPRTCGLSPVQELALYGIEELLWKER